MKYYRVRLDMSNSTLKRRVRAIQLSNEESAKEIYDTLSEAYPMRAMVETNDGQISSVLFVRTGITNATVVQWKNYLVQDADGNFSVIHEDEFHYLYVEDPDTL